MKTKKKNFFAQTYNCDPKQHKAAYFYTLDEAKTFVNQHGGGTVKRRNAKVIYSSGYGLGRVDFDPPLRVWGEVYETNNDPEFKT